ncbi:hypothetical protein GXW74_23300 [Roseomonas eburnea]|uniref:Uncharacterized protein n=1 Tax=Neoroseomonas eburnea TaxID=1346889 RepID=A0A9X9XI96_9PROT|nr:hypothetical protein [Neoroseomonas eburnea]MBR0683432.1 hypothetical protein [Neoroseomonas eburnea]
MITVLRAALLRLHSRAKVSDPARLGEFLHAQGAYVAQKTVLDYCRVKSGRHEQRLFAEAEFQAALQHCRWQVFFGAIADVTAMAEAWLRPHAPGREVALIEALARLHDAALTVEPPPPEELGTATTFSIRSHLAGLQLSPPQPSHTMPLLAEAPLFATLPIHPENRVGEAPSIRGALRFHFVSARQEIERRFDPAGLAERLAPAE